MENNLSSLSNKELVTRLKDLIAVEKRTHRDVVLHLAELDRRRLYLELGNSSLFDYAVTGLGFSRSGAHRRIQAARTITRYPQVKQYLDEGKVSLSTIQSLAQVITPGNSKELLGKVVSGEKEIAKVVAEYRPVSSKGMKDRIVPVVVKKDDGAQGSLLNMMENVVSATLALEDTISEDLYRINVTVGEKLKQKVDRMKELLGSGDLATVLERAVDCYLKAHCPKERQERRKVRKAKVVVKKVVKAIGANKAVKAEDVRNAGVALKDTVRERDGYRCVYVGLDGVRCQARTCLEIDHCQPFGMGGKTEIGNLRTLCRAHNALQARQAYGAERIEQNIAGRREAKTPQLK